MSTAKHLRLVRLTKLLLDILYGLLVFVCAGLLLLIALSPVLIRKEGTMGMVRVPVRLGSREEPQFDVTFTRQTTDPIRSAYVREAEGTLSLETASWPLVAMAHTANLLSAIGLAYVVYLLRGIVRAILDGDPFAAENTRRMRRLGYGVLLVALLVPLVQYIAAEGILRRLPAAVIPLQPAPTFDAEWLLLSLLILVLAHIWSYGLELERDRALTV